MPVGTGNLRGRLMWKMREELKNYEDRMSFANFRSVISRKRKATVQ